MNKTILKNDPAYYNSPLEPNVEKIVNQQNPDIFFVVFDEYASSASLKKYFDFNNERLDSLLLKNDFFLIPNSKSNYNSTPHSIASTLNLQYFNISLEKELTEPEIMLKAQYALKKSFFPPFLAKEGYVIKNYGLCDLQNYPSSFPSFFNDYMIDALYKETLWGRIEKEILWNIAAELPARWHYKKTQKKQQTVINRTTKNLQKILRELTTQNDSPKFVFGHVMIPHAPYYLNKYGEKRMPSSLDYANYKDSLYIDQLIYTNTWIDSIAKAANKNFKRPRVVIIEGDHGNRDIYVQGQEYIREKQFMNLNAYYFSDKDYSMLYDSISPINTFRVVLNKYFNAKLPLLKDSTIFLY